MPYLFPQTYVKISLGYIHFTGFAEFGKCSASICLDISLLFSNTFAPTFIDLHRHLILSGFIGMPIGNVWNDISKYSILISPIISEVEYLFILLAFQIFLSVHFLFTIVSAAFYWSKPFRNRPRFKRRKNRVCL